MITIFLSRSGLDDPYRNRKELLFSRGKAFVESDFSGSPWNPALTLRLTAKVLQKCALSWT